MSSSFCRPEAPSARSSLFAYCSVGTIKLYTTTKGLSFLYNEKRTFLYNEKRTDEIYVINPLVKVYFVINTIVEAQTTWQYFVY